MAPQMLLPSAQQAWTNNYNHLTAPQMLTLPAQDAWKTQQASTQTAAQSSAPAQNNFPQSNGNTSTYSAPAPAVKVPTAAQQAPLLASLNSLDTILGNKNSQSQQDHDAAIHSYDAQDATDQQGIDKSIHNNEQTYTANNQAALLNAARAHSGLAAVLASMGALGGTGSEIVDRLTSEAANSDAGNGKKAFQTNADNIDQAAATTTQKEKERRANADATLENNKQNNESSVLTSRQHIYEQLASLFGANTAGGDDYASKAAALAAPIAATTRATVAPYQAASSLYTPAALQQYLAGTQNLNVAGGPSDQSVAAGAPVNSPLSTTNKKDTLAGVA
jgi:hypothetical protein